MSPELKDTLIRTALDLGASGAAVFPAREIRIEDRLAGMCLEPRCQAYSLAKSCPPHVSGPAGLREILGGYQWALTIKIDLPMEVLLSEKRREVMGLLHEIAAMLEGVAKESGFSRSRGFAGGSCKMIFCAGHLYCRVVEGGGECRHPEQARPSMSGFGINVAEMMESAGLDYNLAVGKEAQEANSQGTLAGLVLIG